VLHRERVHGQVVHSQSWTIADLVRIAARMDADQQAAFLECWAGDMSDPEFNVRAIKTLLGNLMANVPEYADYVPDLLDALDVEADTVTEDDGMTELEKCYALYQQGGVSAVIDCIKEQSPGTPWHFCPRCAERQPFDPHSETCLVCGTGRGQGA